MKKSDPHEFGQILGQYMMKDVGNTILKNRKIIEENPDYYNFMLKNWTPLLFDPLEVKIENSRISLPDVLLANEESENKENIKQTSYGIDTITYEISLKEKKLLVENEIYFQGWSSTLINSDGKKIKINALNTNEVFRSWLLPEGDYKMIAKFEYPNFQFYQSISLISFLLSITIIVILWKKIPLN
jgi:hypothetical protein